MNAPALKPRLRALGLLHVSETLDDVVALATKKRLSPLELMEYLVATEEADRARRSLERRSQRARIGRFKPISDYDWNWPTKIDRDAVEGAIALDFLQERRNVVLVAPQGPISPSLIGRPSSPAPRPPPPSSTASSITPTSSPSRARATASAKPRRPSASHARREHDWPVQNSALPQVRQHRTTSRCPGPASRALGRTRRG